MNKSFSIQGTVGAGLLSASLVLVAGIAGCDSAPELAPTPHAMVGEEGRTRYAALPESLRTPEIPILYFTDRADERVDGADKPVYGAERSDEMSFGVATVAPRRAMGWDEFVKLSTTPGGHRGIRLKVKDVEPLGTIGSNLDRLSVLDGKLVNPPSAVEAYYADLDRFERAMSPWLNHGDDNAAIVFVHGFNNTFDGAALRLAKTWHATGREGVPIVFSWPAAYDAFKPIAYNHDRESGEFAVQALKTLLLTLAVSDRISRVHLIAHSRGTDVATTAIREIDLQIEAALGKTPWGQLARGGDAAEHLSEPATDESAVTAAKVLKLKTLLLVAPDLDLDVFVQRFFAERAGRAADRVTIYSSAKDRAISIADIFFGDQHRLGNATMDAFDPRVRVFLEDLDGMEIIECRVKTKDSHLYLFEHPGALSDMILSVRDGRPAGAAHGRPLAPEGPGFWILDEGYLRPE